MPTRNVNLTEHFDRFIETGVSSGRFGNASEVVREGLRLLEQREAENQAKLKLLRAAVKDGVADMGSDRYETLHSRDDVESFVRRVRNEATGKEVDE